MTFIGGERFGISVCFRGRRCARGEGGDVGVENFFENWEELSSTLGVLVRLIWVEGQFGQGSENVVDWDIEELVL